LPEEAIAISSVLYERNYEKDAAFADKMLVQLSHFKDLRIIPILRQFERDFTGDIRESQYALGTGSRARRVHRQRI